MTKTITMAAMCSLALIATPAAAGSPEVQKMSVEYGDLDLNSPQGLATLNSRIDKAARKVCRINDIETGTRIRSSNAKKCYEAAVHSAAASVAAIKQKEWRGG